MLSRAPGTVAPGSFTGSFLIAIAALLEVYSVTATPFTLAGAGKFPLNQQYRSCASFTYPSGALVSSNLYRRSFLRK